MRPQKNLLTPSLCPIQTISSIRCGTGLCFIKQTWEHCRTRSPSSVILFLPLPIYGVWACPVASKSASTSALISSAQSCCHFLGILKNCIPSPSLSGTLSCVKGLDPASPSPKVTVTGIFQSSRATDAKILYWHIGPAMSSFRLLTVPVKVLFYFEFLIMLRRSISCPSNFSINKHCLTEQ